MQVSKPSTIYLSFPNGVPNTFKVYSDQHGLYFFRQLKGLTPRIKFNVCHAGNYKFNVPVKIEKVANIEIPSDLPGLPPYERQDIKDFVIVDNPNIPNGSPARVFVKEGRIERGRTFYNLIKPVRVFVLLHEIGHFFYGITQADIDKANSMGAAEGEKYLREKRNDSEMKCDLFALIQFLRFGYNRSTAFYSLATVLNKSPDNVRRIKELLNNIQKTQKTKL